MPYTVNKAQLVEQIANVVIARKLPQLLDVKDLSTEDVRIAVEMKKDADEKMIMAYLFKHTLAAAELRGQPHLPDPDREPGARTARAARSASRSSGTSCTSASRS